MAVDKRQSFFRNEIGVNRGSGFTNAANQKLDDARAFDIACPERPFADFIIHCDDR